jgi:pimeloyl-ACP methyl ester carboxylesterase
MATFVLVHGAWQGASTWNFVEDGLRARGHSVHTPTMSGAGIRRYELRPEITLETHVNDVLGVLEFEDLHDVILVGHSYGGMIITSVAEHAAARLAALVYIDAFVPHDGQSAFDCFPAWLANALDQQAAELGDGWRLPALEGRLDLWALKDGPHRDFVRTKLTDFAIACFKSPARLPTNAATKLQRAFIACKGEGYRLADVFEPFAAQARREGWPYLALPTGHDCHVEAPDQCVSFLADLARD